MGAVYILAIFSPSQIYGRNSLAVRLVLVIRDTTKETDRLHLVWRRKHPQQPDKEVPSLLAQPASDGRDLAEPARAVVDARRVKHVAVRAQRSAADLGCTRQFFYFETNTLVWGPRGV